ncbi:MAG: TonB-dependent receptor plug domain-containing protein, partial [Bacteroidales bacterium]|nr:TonB-dependent receptor plug domain-containing protein [Bacteroidales bacterium]
MKKVKLFLTALVIAATTFVASAQNQVSGVVTDRNGEPVAGASVVVDGTTIGVITGANGAYTISAKPGQTLSFLFYGMKPQKQEVTGATMNVVMEDDLMLLDEAVVTAMGITRSEKSIGYAATTVKNEEIAGQRATNVTNTLAGKVAGLQINSTSTDPGAATSVVIRGYSSIAGSNQPLYVVDGIPMTGITSIAPDNIETMTVLKGAAATALYGSRAANGVIIVTTKQGKRNADRNFSIEYNGGVQARQLANLPIFQNDFGQGWNGTQTWIENGSWGPRLDGSYQVYGPVWNGKQRYGKFEALPTNIQDFFEIGWSQNHSVAL